jgi:hypothetical protein
MKHIYKLAELTMLIGIKENRLVRILCATNKKNLVFGTQPVSPCGIQSHQALPQTHTLECWRNGMLGFGCQVSGFGSALGK